VRCLCGLGLRKSSARGGAGLPPGPLRGPARSWLTTVRPIPNDGDRLSRLRDAERGTPTGQRIGSGTLTAKAGPVPENVATGAPRGARAVPKRIATPLWTASFGAPSPHPKEGRRLVSKDRGERSSNPGRLTASRQGARMSGCILPSFRRKPEPSTRIAGALLADGSLALSLDTGFRRYDEPRQLAYALAPDRASHYFPRAEQVIHAATSWPGQD
jgi:hypothetical protein